MAMKSEVEDALHAHTLWRTRFKDFLNGKSSFDIESISATDRCNFGKWLDNEGYRMIPSSLREEICTVHTEFHQIAADIVRKIKEKRFAEAKQDIAQDGALNKASLRLRDLLLKLSLREPAAAVSSSPEDNQASAGPDGTAATLPPGEPVDPKPSKQLEQN